MRIRFTFILALLLSPVLTVHAQLTDEEIIELYDGLRVADVSDGMDVVGLRDAGLMDTKIEAMWRNVDDMSHIIRGIAVTARYVPTNRIVPNPMTPDEFAQWEGNWYGNISTEAFLEHVDDGSIVVIDASGDGDTGSIGSYNALLWVEAGAEGIVTSGSVRDTDEIIKQKIPVYIDWLERGRGIRPGRNELQSVQEPVVVGGVLVYPGDVVIADGDGVIVVPREYAEPVARTARAVLEGDMQNRREAYERLGMPLDPTVTGEDN